MKDTGKNIKNAIKPRIQAAVKSNTDLPSQEKLREAGWILSEDLARSTILAKIESMPGARLNSYKGTNAEEFVFAMPEFGSIKNEFDFNAAIKSNSDTDSNESSLFTSKIRLNNSKTIPFNFTKLENLGNLEAFNQTMDRVRAMAPTMVSRLLQCIYHNSIINLADGTFNGTAQGGDAFTLGTYQKADAAAFIAAYALDDRQKTLGLAEKLINGMIDSLESIRTNDTFGLDRSYMFIMCSNRLYNTLKDVRAGEIRDANKEFFTKFGYEGFMYNGVLIAPWTMLGSLNNTQQGGRAGFTFEAVLMEKKAIFSTVVGAESVSFSPSPLSNRVMHFNYQFNMPGFYDDAEYGLEKQGALVQKDSAGNTLSNTVEGCQPILLPKNIIIAKQSAWA